MAGRFPGVADDREAPRVVAINETLAARYFEGRDPVGQRLYFGSAADDPTYRTIVGVVGDIKNFGVAQDSRNAIYFPYAQAPTGFLSLVLRTSGDPSALAASARATVAELDSQLAAAGVATMDEIVQESLASERFATTLMSAFAAVALILAVVGLYGVVSYAVSVRTHEVGVRVALGASKTDIGRLLVGGSMGLVGAGILLGIGGAWAATRSISGLLFEIEPTDPLTFIAVIATLATAGALAAAVPARRASRVDPVQVLNRS